MTTSIRISTNTRIQDVYLKHEVNDHLENVFNIHKVILTSYICLFKRLLLRLKSSHIRPYKPVVISIVNEFFTLYDTV